MADLLIGIIMLMLGIVLSVIAIVGDNEETNRACTVASLAMFVIALIMLNGYSHDERYREEQVDAVKGKVMYEPKYGVVDSIIVDTIYVLKTKK